MKLYWKNILWNYTVRIWYLWKYRNDLWRGFYCIKLVQTDRKMEECEHRIRAIIIDEFADWTGSQNETSDQEREDR